MNPYTGGDYRGGGLEVLQQGTDVREPTDSADDHEHSNSNDDADSGSNGDSSGDADASKKSVFGSGSSVRETF